MKEQPQPGLIGDRLIIAGVVLSLAWLVMLPIFYAVHGKRLAHVIADWLV